MPLLTVMVLLTFPETRLAQLSGQQQLNEKVYEEVAYLDLFGE
jgi:hypothetical protein